MGIFSFLHRSKPVKKKRNRRNKYETFTVAGERFSVSRYGDNVTSGIEVNSGIEVDSGIKVDTIGPLRWISRR